MDSMIQRKKINLKSNSNVIKILLIGFPLRRCMKSQEKSLINRPKDKIVEVATDTEEQLQ